MIMGCGLVLGDLFYLTDSLLNREVSNDWRVPREAAYPSRDMRPDGLRAQLYQLYGEGQISEEVFQALRSLAERGQLRAADLAVHRARAARRSAGHNDPAVTNALRGIRSRLAQLAEARIAAEKILADLEAHLAEIDKRAAAKEQAAREVVARDEESARQRLVEKAGLISSRDQITARMEQLRTDLSRLDDLDAQLKVKATELEAVQVRNRLSEEMLK